MGSVERGVVESLLANAKRGFCSRIRYDKDDADSADRWRVIEPRSWVEGLTRTSIRALQHEPERGVRHFIPLRIIAVEAAQLEICGDCERFLAGEMSTRTAERRSLDQRPRSTHENWFREYSQCVHDALLDMHVTIAEQRRANALATKLELTQPQMRSVHAAVFAEFLVGCVADGVVSDSEDEQIEMLAAGLAELGWRPG